MLQGVETVEVRVSAGAGVVRASERLSAEEGEGRRLARRGPSSCFVSKRSATVADCKKKQEA